MGDLSKNFSRHEWACPCGCGFDDIDVRLMVIAEIIRHHEGDKPMKPNSGCRCVEHNETIQKFVNPNYIANSSNSKHLIGIAGDFKSDNPKKLYDFLCSLFPNMYGIGLYSWGVHVDTRLSKARWGNI